MNQTQEAARQILGNVSDIQAVVSLCGLTDVNVKLAAIREKASFLYEGKKGPEKIIAGYENDADQTMAMLGMKIEMFLSTKSRRYEDRLQIQRLAELVVQRNRVYFDRRTRHQLTAMEDANGE